MSVADILKDLRGMTELPALQSVQDHLISVTHVPCKRTTGFTSLPHVPIAAVVAGCFQEHEARDRKDGDALILGRCEGGKKSCHVAEVTAVGFDIDGTCSVNEIAERIAASGLARVWYTTYSHRATSTQTRDVNGVLASRHDSSNRPVTDEEMSQYCVHSGKYKHLKDVRVGAGGVAQIDEEGKRYLAIEHDAIDKMRLINFYEEPIPVPDIGLDMSKAIYRESAKQSLGADALDIIDLNCCSVNRLHFLPAKPTSTNAHHFIKITDGKLLDWRPMWDALKEPVKKQREVAAANFKTYSNTPLPLRLHQIKSCLDVIPPVDYGIWFKALAAVCNLTGGDPAARALADHWSQSAPEAYDDDVFDDTWRSILESDYAGPRAGMGTLVSLARQFVPDFALPTAQMAPSPTYKRSW